MQWSGWTYQVGSSQDDIVNAVQVDTSNVVLLAGSTNGQIGSTASAGGSDIFAVKLDSGGSQDWIFQTGSNVSDTALALHLDASGNTVLTGMTQGGLNGQTNAGGQDVFAIKLDSAGAHQWTFQTGTDGDDMALAVHIDGSGSIVLAGSTEGSFAGFSNAGGSDVFVMKLDNVGSLSWTLQLGSAGNDIGSAVHMDSSGNVWVGGRTDDALTGVNFGMDDGFIAKISGAGALQFVHQFGGAGTDIPTALQVDSADIIVAGYTDGNIFPDQVNKGGQDAFVIKFSEGGRSLLQTWTVQFGTDQDDFLYALRTDETDAIFVAGSTFGDLNPILANVGGGDVLIAKIESNGSGLSVHREGTTGVDEAKGIALDRSGNVIVGGYTAGSLVGTSNGQNDAFAIKAPVLHFWFLSGKCQSKDVDLRTFRARFEIMTIISRKKR